MQEANNTGGSSPQDIQMTPFGRYLTLDPRSVKPGNSTRVEIGEMPVAAALIKLLREAYFVEDAIYVEINSRMLKDNKLLGVQFKPSSKYYDGQAIIRYTGPGSVHTKKQYWKTEPRKLTFSIGNFMGDRSSLYTQYKDVYEVTVNADEAAKICAEMMKLGKLYNAHCDPIRIIDKKTACW